MQLYHDDCFNIFPKIETKSIDLVLCDMPYGITRCKWDSVLDLEKMWDSLENICKSNAAIVLTAAQPFTSILVTSNLKWFKYDWIWKKPKGTCHLLAKKMPLKDKEDILIFYKKTCVYNPQFTEGLPYKGKAGKPSLYGEDSFYGKDKKIRNDNPGKRYPKQILSFAVVDRGNVHPTQKPVALMEYLIKTYSNENDTVLDFCMGSGTTGVACMNLNRNFIGIEKEKEYYDIAVNRINTPTKKITSYYD